MKIKLTLSNPGGEIDSRTIEIEAGEHASLEIGEELTDAVEDFLGQVPTWDVGDTFTITELE